MISVPQTASFDANLAKVVGLPAAILYNQLLYLSQTDMAIRYDNDGWFYYTARDFEEATNYNADTFTRTAKRLVDAGFIEKKRAYIKGTSVSTTHFRFLKLWVPNSHRTRGQKVSPDTSCYIIEKEIEKDCQNFGNPNCTPSPDDLAPLGTSGSDSPLSSTQAEDEATSTMSEKAEPCEAVDRSVLRLGGRLTNDVFDAPVEEGPISVKPGRGTKQSSEDQHAWAVTDKVVKIIKAAGHRCPDKYLQLKSAIKARIKEGVVETEIIKVANNYVNDKRPFYKPSERSPHSAFSEDYFYQYLNIDNDSRSQAQSIYGRN